MNIKEYFWDLSEPALKETEQILRNPEHPDFARRIIRILTRNDQPKDLFSLITKDQFIEAWPHIRREWKKNDEAPDYYNWWDSVYEQLAKPGRKSKPATSSGLEDIGRKIRLAREKKGWTQADLARRSEMKQPDISAIEKGKKNITIETLTKLETILEITKNLESTKVELTGPERSFILDGTQKNIYDALSELAGPGAKAFYWDTCWLRQHGEALESRSHLLGHLFREIESSVRDLLRLCLGVKKVSGDSAFKREIEGMLKLLGIPQKDFNAQTWLALADQTRLPILAHRVGLSRPREYSEELQYEFLKFDRFLNWILSEVRKHSSNFIKILDELLAKENPTKVDADALCEIPDAFYIRNYFFEKCKNAKWLIILKDTNIFKYPTKIKINENGSWQFPFWAEAEYLARMAKEAPREVAEIIRDMPEVENPSIINQLVLALSNMPVEVMATLSDQMSRWVENEYSSLFSNIEKLILSLATGGKFELAFDLTKRLLNIRAARMDMDEYFFEKRINAIVPELARLAGLPVFQWLCDSLIQAMNNKAYNDFSYFWRPDIKKPERYQQHDPTNVLIDLIIKIANQLNETNGIDTIITVLDGKSQRIFKRLALYLLGLHPNSAVGWVDRYLADQALFEDGTYWREYSFLLKSSFGLLPIEKQNLIIKWIEMGPDFSKFPKRPAEDEIEKWRQLWQRERMDWFGENLPLTLKPYYEELVQKFGSVEQTNDFEMHENDDWERSPKSIDELGALTVDDLVVNLNNWRPSIEERNISAEGLARILKQLAKTKPGFYTANANRFKQLQSLYAPTYLLWLFWGLEEVVRDQKTELAWLPLLELCQWCVKQARVSGSGKDDISVETHWNHVVGAIADLLGEGMQRKLIPLKVRNQVWNIIAPITEDPDPTIEYERNNNIDSVSLSINSIRGKAMHAVMRYGWWVYQFASEKSEKYDEQKLWDETLGLKQVLEKHLEPTQEQTLAIHSIYGEWFPWLLKMDREWTLINKRKIFPEAIAEKERWDAAWESYVLRCHPYNDVFDILKAEYFAAIDRLEEFSDNIGEITVWHLMIFYLRGLVELDSELIIRLYKKSSDDLRASIMRNVWLDLKNQKGNCPPAIKQRLMAWWEKRKEVVLLAADPADYSKEMTTFGHWFETGEFDLHWAIKQLLFVLETFKHVEAVSLILERLKDNTEVVYLETIEVLRALSENENNMIGINLNEIIKILEKIACGNNQEAKKEALVFCNILLSKGYTQVRNVLQMCEERSR